MYQLDKNLKFILLNLGAGVCNVFYALLFQGFSQNLQQQANPEIVQFQVKSLGSVPEK